MISAPAVEIRASADTVFSILARVEAYHMWGMPFTIRMDAASLPLAVGTVITEHVVLDPARPTSIRLQRVVVTEVDPSSRRLHWESVMVARWLLHAVRLQHVCALPNGNCVYETSDTMRGALAPLVLCLYGNAVARGFAEQGRALKAAAEGASIVSELEAKMHR